MQNIKFIQSIEYYHKITVYLVSTSLAVKKKEERERWRRKGGGVVRRKMGMGTRKTEWQTQRNKETHEGDTGSTASCREGRKDRGAEFSRVWGSSLFLPRCDSLGPKHQHLNTSAQLSCGHPDTLMQAVTSEPLSQHQLLSTVPPFPNCPHLHIHPATTTQQRKEGNAQF